jgi:hypothetical protein
MPPSSHYETTPPAGVHEELQRSPATYEILVREALEYLDNPDVDDMALARMYIERGFSEDLAYWLVREAEVKRAPR